MTQLALCNTLGASRAPTTLAARVAAILRRRVGTLIGIPDNALGNGAPNLLSAPEFAGGLADAPTRGGLVTASALAGYDGAIAFGHDGSTLSHALKTYVPPAGVAHTMSVIVEMTDGLAPSWGAGGATGGTSTFAIVANGQLPAAGGSEYVVTLVSGNTYRVSWTFIPSGSVGNNGIYKYSTNNNRTFKVTGYKLELGSTATAYTPQAILRQRGVYQDTTGTTAMSAVGEVLGLMTDRLGVLGPELLPALSDAVWAKTNAAWSTAGGKAVATSCPDGQSYYITGKSAANKSYRYTLTLDSVATGGVYISIGGSISSAVFSAAGTYTGVLRTTTSNGNINLVTGGTTTLSIAAFSTFELTGNHATQPTPANKPTLVRVPKRLGPNLVSNGGFDTDTSGWTASGAALSVVGGQMQVQTSGAAVGYAYQSIATGVGKQYQMTVDPNIVSGTGLISVGVGPGGTAMYFGPSFTGAERKVVPFTATASTTFVSLFQYTATAGLQARFDNIEVREVLEWANVISLDGANDFFTIGPSTFTAGTLTSNMDVTMSVIRKKSGVIILAHDANSAGSRFIGAAKAEALSAVNNVGTAWSIAVNGILLGAVNSVTRAQLDTAMPVGVPCTVEFRNLDLSAWTNFQVGNFASWELGAEIGAIAINAAASDSERDLIRKWMASTNRAPYWGELPTLSLDFASGVYVVSNGEI